MTALLDALRLPAAQLLDAVALAIGAHDAGGRVVFVNRALCGLFGVEPSRLVGRVLYEGLSPTERTRYLEHLGRWSRGEARSLVVEIRTLARREQRYAFVPSPVRDTGGAFLGVFYAILPLERVNDAFEEQLRSTAGLARSMLQELGAELSSRSLSGDEEVQALRADVPALARLSQREWDVARRLAGGKRTARIAAELGIRPNTVRNHLKAVFRKVGVSSQAELIGRIRYWSGRTARPPASRPARP